MIAPEPEDDVTEAKGEKVAVMIWHHMWNNPSPSKVVSTNPGGQGNCCVCAALVPPCLVADDR